MPSMPQSSLPAYGDLLKWALRALLLTLALASPAAAQQAAPAPAAGSDGGVPGSAAPNSADTQALPIIVKVAPTEVVRGSVVTISGQRLPKDKTNLRILLADIDIGEPIEVDAEGTSARFVVPELAGSKTNPVRIPFGWALVKVQIRRGESWSPALAPSDAGSAYIHVGPGVQPPGLKLVRADPAFVPLGASRLLLVGDGMSPNVDDYALLLDQHEVKLCSKPCTDGRLARITSPQQLEVSGPFPESWEGHHTVSLRAGDVVADKTLDVRFMHDDVHAIRNQALFASLLLLALVAALAFVGPAPYKIAPEALVDNPVRRFGVFLLDRETDTYSLSMCQFYLWTAAAVFAYTYLTLARVLCQGVLELADVPENLPGILAISVSTSFLSAGVTKQQGPKGAGNVKPSLSDLITSGGLVLPERFQFLIWTLIAVGAFLLAVLQSDPTNVTAIPGIPGGLLLLSGVSAGGYLGGKLARRPGPVMDDVRPDADKSVLTLVGRGLDPTATFELCGTPLDKYLVAKDGDPPAVSVVAPAGAKENATSLALHLFHWQRAWLGSARLELTIINRDGQRATWPFTLDDDARKKLAALAVEQV